MKTWRGKEKIAKEDTSIVTQSVAYSKLRQIIHLIQTNLAKSSLKTQKYPHPPSKKRFIHPESSLLFRFKMDSDMYRLVLFSFQSFWRGVSGNHSNPQLDFLPMRRSDLYASLDKTPRPHSPAENKCDSNHADWESGGIRWTVLEHCLPSPWERHCPPCIALHSGVSDSGKTQCEPNHDKRL